MKLDICFGSRFTERCCETRIMAIQRITYYAYAVLFFKIRVVILTIKKAFSHETLGGFL